MSRRRGVRGISLADLGPKALAQIAALGPPPVKGPRASLMPELPEHKYGVSPSDERTADGITFDSKLEMNAYCRLKNLRIPFTRQPEYLLQPGFDYRGKKIRPVLYVGDFLIDPDGKKIMVDLKGFRTEVFQLKWKLLLFHCPELDAVQVKTLPALMELLAERGLFKR